ncbi:MAG: hypothetical protein K2F60_00365 [Oscillospiraceae bacterium]|nr:hypothetical protein [Oscillospiraceae bacterium]
MLLHTIISPADIFYDFSKETGNIKKTEELCVTDPFHYLEKDEYYKQYIQMRK